MQLLDKRERMMNSEEKLKLEIMRSMTAGKGFNLRNENVKFNFTANSNSAKMASFLMNRFNIKFKDEKEAKIFWPEKDLEYVDGSNKEEISAEYQDVNKKEEIKKPVKIDVNKALDIDDRAF